MTFGNPPMFSVLVIVLLLLGLFLWKAWRKRQLHLTQFVRSRLLAQLTVGVSSARQKLRLAFLFAAVGLVLLALAEPRWGYVWEEVRQRGLDIVVAVDCSRSMLAEDVAPNRLTRAKLAALELIRQAKTDRLGLVAFAGTAFLQCPLTLDDEAYRQCVNTLEVGLIPQGGTALAESIRTAMTAFKNDEENQKVIVILTDGEDHEPGAVEAADEAAKSGVRIFTIGIGTSQGEMLRMAETNGSRSFIKDPEGNAVKSRLNEPLLQQIAATARGLYLPLRGANTIDLLYERGLAPILGRLLAAGSNHSLPAVKKLKDRFQWPLGLAMILLIAEIFLPYQKRVRRPEKPIARVGGPELAKWVAIALLAALSNRLEASSSQALKWYESGRYESAWKEYQRLRERNPKDPRLAFNSGAAAYQSRAYEEAVRDFNDSLSTTDLALQERGYYNRGNANFRFGEEASEPDQKTSRWEQSIKDFESALKLNPKDADAKFNRDHVKKVLEEFKKQQEQQKQQQQKSDDSKKQDQQKQDQQKDDKQKEDKQNSDKNQGQQPQPDQSKKEQPKDKQPSKDQQKPGEGQDKKQQPEGQGNKPPPKKDDNAKSKADSQPKNQPGETNQVGTADSAPMNGRMTRQQAQQLLDAQKGEEQALIYLPPELKEAPPRSIKDW